MVLGTHSGRGRALVAVCARPKGFLVTRSFIDETLCGLFILLLFTGMAVGSDDGFFL